MGNQLTDSSPPPCSQCRQYKLSVPQQETVCFSKYGVSKEIATASQEHKKIPARLKINLDQNVSHSAWSDASGSPQLEKVVAFLCC